MNAMNPNATVAQLYHLLIYADGRLDKNEIRMGKKLIEIEQLNEELFNEEVQRLETLTKSKGITQKALFSGCVQVLNKLEKKVQIRYIAWMCAIANSDGFMDKEEWKLIYRLYHNELKLPLEDIMDEHRKINQQVKGEIWRAQGVA